MGKSPRSAAVEQSRKRLGFVDILKQQMLDLKVLRKKVAEAESAERRKKEAQANALLPHPRLLYPEAKSRLQL